MYGYDLSEHNLYEDDLSSRIGMKMISVSIICMKMVLVVELIDMKLISVAELV